MQALQGVSKPTGPALLFRFANLSTYAVDTGNMTIIPLMLNLLFFLTSSHKIDPRVTEVK